MTLDQISAITRKSIWNFPFSRFPEGLPPQGDDIETIRALADVDLSFSSVRLTIDDLWRRLS